jgi:hypothetical protein
MAEISKREDEWQRRATSAAIAEARKVVASNGPFMNTPVGRLSDLQWGWIIAGAIFSWITVRFEQAIAEGRNPEETVRLIEPSPEETAMVRSILPMLADQAKIDWSKPLAAWSKDEMTSLVLLAWQLIHGSENVLDQAPHKILRKPGMDWKNGDPIPF